MIGSHMVYKVKTDEQGRLKLKARICPHGNGDAEKDEVLKDSTTAQLDIIRIVFTISTLVPFKTGFVDINGAHLQSGPIRRDIYVRPPKELDFSRPGRIWNLAKPPYGITEAGRQWTMTLEGRLLEDTSLERAFGVSQMFIKMGSNGELIFIMVKSPDDILFAGTHGIMG